MPGYPAHKKVSKLVAATTAATCFICANLTYKLLGVAHRNIAPLPSSVVIAAGAYAGGTILSPDLDIPSAPYNHWRGLKHLWLPYQIIVKHRSPLSHWPVLSSVTKLIYLFFIINALIIGGILSFNVAMLALDSVARIRVSPLDIVMLTARPLQWKVTWLFLTGEVVGEAMHSVTDFLHGRRSVRYFKGAVPTVEEDPETPRSEWRDS